MSGKSKQRTKPQSRSREQRQAEKQTLVIWALLANGGEGYGNQLKPEVKKPEREALLKSGLISVEKQKRAYWLSVTDRGWRWAEDHLSDQTSGSLLCRDCNTGGLARSFASIHAGEQDVSCRNSGAEANHPRADRL